MKKIQSRGFTVIELVLYIGLLTIFLVVLTEIFVSVLDVQLESEATSHVTQDGRYIMSRLFYDVSRSQVILSPAAPGSTSSTLQLSIGGAIYSYSVGTNGMLTATDASGSVPLNGFDTTISNVLFTRLGNSGGKNTITANFTVSSRVTRPQGSESTPFQVTMGQR